MAGRCPTEEQYPLVFWAKKTNSFKPSAKKNLSVAYHLKFTVVWSYELKTNLQARQFFDIRYFAGQRLCPSPAHLMDLFQS